MGSTVHEARLFVLVVGVMRNGSTPSYLYDLKINKTHTHSISAEVGLSVL